LQANYHLFPRLGRAHLPHPRSPAYRQRRLDPGLNLFCLPHAPYHLPAPPPIPSPLRFPLLPRTEQHLRRQPKTAGHALSPSDSSHTKPHHPSTFHATHPTISVRFPAIFYTAPVGRHWSSTRLSTTLLQHSSSPSDLQSKFVVSPSTNPACLPAVSRAGAWLRHCDQATATVRSSSDAAQAPRLHSGKLAADPPCPAAGRPRCRQEPMANC